MSEDQKNNIEQAGVEISSNPQIPKTENNSQKPSSNESKNNETTYGDIFTEIGKGVKNTEAFEKLKESYLKQLDSTIANKKLSEVKEKLRNEYSEISSDLLAEKKAESIVKSKMEERDAEYKAFLESQNLSELTEDELNEAISYGVLKETSEVEKAKSNPMIAKMVKESIIMAKAKNKPLPQATNQNASKEELLKEIQELDKIRITRGLDGSQRPRYNVLWTQYSSLTNK